MKLEQQVCSFELAERLKEWGVKQESYFYWTEKEYPSGEYVLIPAEFYSCGCDGEPGEHRGCDLREIAAERVGGPGRYDPETAYSAFTVAELGEMLPVSVQIRNDLLLFEVCKRFDRDNKEIWMVDYLDRDGHIKGILGFAHHSEAEARAAMLIHLLENKLITL